MMELSSVDLICLLSAVVAALMVGSTHLKVNVSMFALQTVLLSVVTWLYASQRSSTHLYLIAAAFFALKAIGIPVFLNFIIRKVDVQRDGGTLLASPLAMHLSIGFMALAYILARQLPIPPLSGAGWPSATAAISLVCTGLVLMLTRRIALSQIIGFLVMENGIYLFGLTQTRGMPLLVETGIFLDVLAGVMIAGLIAFRIKKNFEHIDVTMLADLKE